MSVFLDHIYIKSTKEAYTEAFNFFQKVIPEEIFVHGESDDPAMPWGGFYVYFGGRFFLEFLDPEKCLDSNKIGMSFSCLKEFRGSFLKLIQDSNEGNNIENASLPEQNPMMEICRLHAGNYLSTWGCEYSDDWEKEWGSQIAKYSMLSAFGDVKSMEIHSLKDNQSDISKHFNWIDPRIATGEQVNLPLENGSSQFAFNYLDKGQELIVIDFENKEKLTASFESESFSVKFDEKMGQLIIVI